MSCFKSVSLVLVLLSVFSHRSAADTIPSHKRISVQISPLALVDFYNGSCYRFGSQVNISRNFALSADFGGYFPHFNAIRNNRGFNADFRVKYLFSNTNSGISLNYFYKEQSFEYQDYYIEESNDPVVIYTRKRVHCINLNFEHSFYFLKSRRAYLNLFAGLGIRFRDVRSTFESKEDFDNLKKGGDSQSLYFVLIPGQNTWLNPSLGMRLGFYLF